MSAAEVPVALAHANDKFSRLQVGSLMFAERRVLAQADFPAPPDERRKLVVHGLRCSPVPLFILRRNECSLVYFSDDLICECQPLFILVKILVFVHGTDDPRVHAFTTFDA